jgi:hypothetical protein
MSVTAVWRHFMKVDASEPSGQGVLFFDQITQRLCHFLSEVSWRGLERILAVALSPSALAERGAWRLLQTGASDIFAWDHSTNPAQEVAARFERWEQVDEIEQSPLVRKNQAGQSPAWIRALRQVVEAFWRLHCSLSRHSCALAGPTALGSGFPTLHGDDLYAEIRKERRTVTGFSGSNSK